MSDNARRKLLKSIAAGSGAIAAGNSLPESWSHPVVDTVMLPGHAQTSLVCGTLPLGNPGEISATMTYPTAQQTGLALLASDGTTIDFPIVYDGSPISISASGLPDDLYYLIAGVILGTPLPVQVTLVTEGGTQVFNTSVPNAPSFPADFTLIAEITIPGGSCPGGSGTYPGPIPPPPPSTVPNPGASNW